LENIACIKLLEALKFRKEWEFKDNIFFKWAWWSEVQYAMLALEYKNIYLS
jgi:RimJ/RimL family protein N-acetyltransferase